MSNCGEIQRLPLGAQYLDYHPAYLSFTEADACLRALLQETPWQQDTLRFGGKPVLVPRLQAWYGDAAAHYGYSGLTLRPLPWTDRLQALRARLEDDLQLHFNAVLLNFYRNGDDSVAWHSDDEAALGSAPIIASLSLGAARRFELKPRGNAAPSGKRTLELEHGSLVVMGPGLQQHWQHRLPKQPQIAQSRINLTFRLIHAMA